MEIAETETGLPPSIARRMKRRASWDSRLGAKTYQIAACGSSTAAIKRYPLGSCPHLAARFGNVRFDDVHAEIFQETLQASQRPRGSVPWLQGLQELQHFLLLLRGQPAQLPE